ncbi:class I SAM-dependent methyltransferase [Litoreibacter janthinus]|uniref:Methyltransferase domain-containing protein n=1 Tax=Litoreibacter janthinus TaxID=670154 RepID=A0A1I6HVF1_9RHOB|nr:class I SAM-dependent methyltransferase [Litoreibacter janthinus]SFR58415.1 Methyltransferase domain-containing protein [Litoreibacter janthinus]
MHLDVQDLKKFYYRTGLGRVAQRAVRDQVRDFWPDTKGQTVVGYGFAAPLLRPFIGEARRVIALMPGPQGVMHWPAGQGNMSVLCEETLWPLQTGQADRLVLLHGLETSENPTALLEECFRVLGPGGRALFVVPNRAGLWSRRDATPFGFGRPYSLTQLEAQLKRHSFTPERHRAALFAPPSQRKVWLKWSSSLERIGGKVSSYFAGGVLIVEASKQVYAPKKKGLTVDVRAPLRVLEGAANPVAGRGVTQRIASAVSGDSAQKST